MLLGLNKKTEASADNADIFSVTTQEFESRIIAESQKRPVLIDFWAPWCGPCKQLMPVLEEAVSAKGGKIALAKVNIDENPELAQAFRVQSVPTVIAFYQGQPVSGFQGVRPKSEIEQVIHQVIQLHESQQPGAVDIPGALAQAQEFFAAQDFETTQRIYEAVLAHDPSNTAALGGILRVMIAKGELDQARATLGAMPEQMQKDQPIQSAKTALELASAAPSGSLAEIEMKLSESPDNPEILFALSEAALAAGQKEKAVGALIAIIRKNRAWEDEKARKQLLKYFEAWGPADPESLAGRRKLSSVLFS